VAERESQIVLGLDPDPMALWPQTDAYAEVRPADSSTGSSSIGHFPEAHFPAGRRAAVAVAAHCRAVIDAVAPACVAVKLQLACFERLGAPGWDALRAAADHARACGLLVIADGKRGDISVSAQAYAQALCGTTQTPYGQVEGLGADMVTVNPLMGTDTIEPFIAAARAADGGVLALVRTSNPGAADIEDLELAGGGTVWERIAVLVHELGEAGDKPDDREVIVGGRERAGVVRGGVGEAGLSDVGAVMGATVPRHLERARELMPHAVFLLPGVGAQGARVEDLACAFAPGRAGGLITASRGIAGAHLTTRGSPASAARAEAERLRAVAWSLG
jgi:orotidine-5'-phosphate decarboxylase